MRRQWHKRLLALLASCIISGSTVGGQNTSDGNKFLDDDHLSTPTTSTHFLIESPESPIYTQVLKQGMYMDTGIQPKYLN